MGVQYVNLLISIFIINHYQYIALADSQSSQSVSNFNAAKLLNIITYLQLY